MSKLTDEQKQKFGSALARTYEVCAQDVSTIEGWGSTIAEKIEIATDADRPVTFGYMTKEEYEVFCAAYSDPDTKKWLKKLFRTIGD